MSSVVSVTDQIESSYESYSLKVIQDRAIPHAYDGLKPVQRKLLYAMYDLGLLSNSQHRKSARVIGETIGKYSPHGDISAYEALVRLVQDFTTRYPLASGQGNWGTDEHPAAAHRYTEVRLSKVGHLLLQAVEDNTVDFVTNFDGSTTEPVLLPSPLPTLLLNGASGIAVGLSTSIPSHNLGDVLDTTIALLVDPELTVEELLPFIAGPDFPKGGLICNESLHQIYSTGNGSVRVKVRAHLEKRLNDPHRYIVITHLGILDKVKMLEKFVQVLNDKLVPQIKSIEDESKGDDTRVVIQLKQTTEDYYIVWKKIVKTVGLVQSFKVNMIALIDEFPHRLNLKQLLTYWIETRVKVVERLFKYKIEKLQRQLQTTQTYLKIVADKKKILKLIMDSETQEDIVAGLLKLKFQDFEVEQVLNTPIRRLSKLSEAELQNTYNEQLTKLTSFQQVIQSTSSIKDYIHQELETFRTQFGDKRKCEIQDVKTFDKFDLPMIRTKE